MKFPNPFRREEKASKTHGLYVVGNAQATWSDRTYRAFADEGYQRNVVAYQAINRIAEAVSSVNWLVFNGKDELTEHPLLSLLARPNPMQSGSEYLINKVGFLMISGNSYEERVLVGGKPKELYTLRPDRMTVRKSANGFPAGYEHKIDNGKPVTWEVDQKTGVSDIWHTKLFNPLDDWLGQSPIQAGAYSVDQHNEAMTWVQALLQNSARPSGALVTQSDKTLVDEEFNRLKKQIEDQYSGARNAGRPMLLEGGLDWKSMGLSPSDMAILETKYSSARDICLAFGVPPQLMGIPGDNTYSNYQEARLAFWEDTVIPLVDRIADDYNHWLSPLFGNVTLKPDYDQIPAIAEKRRVIWEMAEKSTVLTINERRAMMGYDDIEGGDAIMVNMNQSPLEDVVSGSAADRQAIRRASDAAQKDK